jgi:amino acid adenylation domain-containing protein
MIMDYALLSCLKGPRTTKNAGLTIVDLFRRQARLTPDAAAIVYKEFSLSYRRFDRLTDLLAGELVRRGLQRGGRAGILADHNETVPLALMAVIKAGAAYVPLNPRHPPNRLRYMIQDAGIGHVITAGGGWEDSGFKGTVIDGRKFVEDPPDTGDSPAEELPCPSPDDLMIIEYTSGSTGNPKGVMVRHGNTLDFSEYYRELTGLQAGGAVSSYASLSFIIHIYDFFPAFMAGAAVHIIDDEIRLDPGAVNAYFEKNRITQAFLPFSFGQRFVLQTKNHSLRSLTMAGENFSPLPELPLGYAIYNCYGCTECGGVTLGEVRAGESRITAGTPAYNAEIYLVDDQENMVKQGETGQLCVAGPLVGAGYLNLEEKTAGAFTKNPFNDEAGYERLYHTGDLARITEMGKIEIAGRADFQIKIRGYRIEPGEIDACIRRYPGVLESVTVALENKTGAKQLVAYIAAEGRIEPGDLRSFLSGSLPPYMVPHFIEQLDKLPRNLNGKIDRSRLPPPSFTAGTYIPPETEIEHKLAHLWAAVLGLEAENIGRDADFFELGGDSLRATVLTFEISTVFKTNLSSAEIFTSSVLKEQAGILSSPKSFNAVYIYSSRGSRTPLFFVHGGNTGAEAFADMAQELPKDQPFYSFENYNIYNPREKIRGFVPLAKKYVEFMRARIPKGPYMLGGWSYGGLLAFEMALLLEQNGEEVEHLFLMDPNIIRNPEEKGLWEKLADPINYHEYLAKDPLFERFRKLGLLGVLVENNLECARDILNYTPSGVYRGKVTLFKAMKVDMVNLVASEEKSSSVTAERFNRLRKITREKRDNGFGGYAPRLRVIEIDETHDGLIRKKALNIIVPAITGG